MILPIYIYGNTVLRKKCEDIDPNYKNLNILIKDMFETMHNANGIGLAAPQVGFSINLFVIDLNPLSEDNPKLKGLKKVFINPKIINEYGDNWEYDEGCLSIPDLNDIVIRKKNIEIEYMDEKFNLIKEKISGMEARVIQHEYDHLKGVLFTDHLSAKRKNIINRKLNTIKKGKFQKRYNVKLSQK